MARNCTVLYVEDNEDDLLLFKEAVKRCRHCFDVEWVNSVSAAKDYLRGHGPYSDRASHHPFPRLVLSDYHMPGETGKDLLKWIRMQPWGGELGVILFTSTAKPGLIDSCYGCGLNAFLVKPSNMRPLVHVVECLKKCLGQQPPNFKALEVLPGYRAAKAA